MSRWKRVVRGMLGMGAAFATGAGLIMSTLAAVALTLRGGEGWRDFIIPVVGGSVWGFLMGMTFGGALALLSRGRSFESLSLPRFTALGVGAGLFFNGVLALNAWDAWSTSAAVTSGVLFVVLGGGCATASLLLARKAEGAFGAGEPVRCTAEGGVGSAVDAGEQVPHPLERIKERERARP
jgi:hypothetical protein